jgi:hypothetical protein
MESFYQNHNEMNKKKFTQYSNAKIMDYSNLGIKKKLICKVTLILIISYLVVGCNINNPLIGNWQVYKLQDLDGSIVDVPSAINIKMEIYEKYYIQYSPDKDSEKLDYSLKKDNQGLYIKVNWHGQVYGQRFTLLDNGDVQWNLLEPGTNRPLKMWMRRTQ